MLGLQQQDFDTISSDEKESGVASLSEPGATSSDEMQPGTTSMARMSFMVLALARSSFMALASMEPASHGIGIHLASDLHTVDIHGPSEQAENSS